MKKALAAMLLEAETHWDSRSKRRHPEVPPELAEGPVEGVSASHLVRPYATVLALLAGFLLVLALSACGETNGLDIEATATALASVAGTPEASEPSESTRLGQWVEDSELAMVAHAVEDPAIPNSSRYQLKPGTRLVAVELEIGCLADSHNFTPQETNLIDSRGRRHDPVYNAMAEHAGIPTGVISMGDRVRGWLAFELPEGVTAESLEYKPNIWNRVIDLRVSLVE